jgi:hypothetical protein
MEEFMSQENANLNASIAIISRELVAQFATDELDFFDDLYAQYQDNPARFKEGASSHDPLEFGFDELLVASTPVIISMVTITLKKLVQMIGQALQGEAENLIQERTKKTFERVLKGNEAPPDRSEFVTFSAQEIELLHKLGVQEGVTLGLPKTEAAKIMYRLTQPMLQINRR